MTMRKIPIPAGRWTVRDILLLALGAFLYTVASPPYEWSVAAWLALAPLYLVLHDKPPKAAFGAGLLYGVLSCTATAPWVYFTISAYFPLFFPVDLLFTVLSYSFFVGSYMGLAASFSCVLMHSGSPLLCWLSIPALWVSGEFARSSLFSGFSWELLGYTQYRHLALIQIADLTGVYGLSFLMALSSYVAAKMCSAPGLFQTTIQNSESGTQNAKSAFRNPHSATPRFPWPALAILTAGIVLVLLYGTIRLRQYRDPSFSFDRPVTIAVVQGNVSSAQRWQRVHYANSLLKYISVTRQGIEGSQPDLVVWPEFAVGFYLDKEPLLRAQLGQLTRSANTSLLLGAPRMEESTTGTHYYNSAYLLSPDGRLVDVYDKIRLVPFAEYRPLTLPVLLHHSSESPSEFTAGRRSTVFPLPQSSFGVMICYEAIYPHLARRLVRGGAQFLVNISNDTWLVEGGTAAAEQHFSMAVFRAVENKRSLVRAATAGISGFVDPTGRLRQLSTTQEGVSLGQVFPRQELTVYARYGDWFAWTCAGLALTALLKARESSRSLERHDSMRPSFTHSQLF
jgi:apolipoprotein N-acyltransferase